MTETTADAIDGLSALESAAIGALMSSSTIEHAAKQVGVHERTLRRWLVEKEHFRRALRREQQAAMASVTARLQQSATQAVSTLEAVMAAPDAPHASKVSAARTLLELAHARVDMDDLSARIEAVEEQHRRSLGPARLTT